MSRQKREGVVVVPIKLWLIRGRDDDLVEFFESIPSGQRASAIISAMRHGLLSKKPSFEQNDEATSILDSLGKVWQ